MNGWVAATHLVCHLHRLQLRRSRHKLTYYSSSPIMSLCKLIYFIYPYFSLVILSIFFSHSNSFKRSSDSGFRSSSASKSHHGIGIEWTRTWGRSGYGSGHEDREKVLEWRVIAAVSWPWEEVMWGHRIGLRTRGRCGHEDRKKVLDRSVKFFRVRQPLTKVVIFFVHKFWLVFPGQTTLSQLKLRFGH